MKIALTYNLKKELPKTEGLPPDFYAECDDIETIENVRDALCARHGDVLMIEADEDAFEKLRKARPDMVFNMAEGIWGESRESQLPAIMDMLRIPYTGSSPLTLGLCLNKGRAKQVLAWHGIATPRFVVTDVYTADIAESLSFPMIVKPLFEGSSKGVKNDSIVHDEEALRDRIERVRGEYSQSALIEEFLPGREFTVALLGNGKDLRTLPIVEINYSSLPEGINPIYSYEAKWVLDTPSAPLDIFSCPAKVDAPLKKAVDELSLAAYRALDVKDWCRIDIRLDSNGRPGVIELNPLPGILMDPNCNSCFPKAARSAGMTFTELVNSVVDAARKRYRL
ncbi:MAG: ATP-grasp domain-containing protein [Deltaproteobacteria bacterium]|nr:ATP-grasp domain-containing protein [Deltaproteobacteria bacterium]